MIRSGSESGASVQARGRHRHDLGGADRRLPCHEPFHLHERHSSSVQVGGLPHIEPPHQIRVEHGERPQRRRARLRPPCPSGQRACRVHQPPRAGQLRDRLGSRSAQHPDPAVGGGGDPVPLVRVFRQPLPRLRRHLHREPQRPRPLVQLPDRQPPRHRAELVDGEQDLPARRSRRVIGEQVDQRPRLRLGDRGLRRPLEDEVPSVRVSERAAPLKAIAQPPPQGSEPERDIIEHFFPGRTNGG